MGLIMITSNWIDSQNTILLQTYHTMAMETLQQHHEQQVALLLAHSTTPIAIIHDLRASPYLPGRGYGENVKAWAEFYHHSPVKMVIFVVDPPEMSIAAMLQLTHMRYSASALHYEIVHTIDQAVAKITQDGEVFA